MRRPLFFIAAFFSLWVLCADRTTRSGREGANQSPAGQGRSCLKKG